MKAWQLVALVVVVVAAVALGYAGYSRFLGQGASQESANRQVVQAQRGTLENTINATGSLVMPHQAKLSFDSSGTVEAVTAKVGDTVKAGQVLAQLNATSLQRALDQAQANLSTALIALEEAWTPYTEADIVDAEAAVRDARVGLENARRNLQIAQVGTSAKEIRDRENEANWYEANHGQALLDYAAGKIDQAALDKAWSNLVTAKEKLAQAILQQEVSAASAVNNVAKAEDTLRKAEQELAKRRAGADPNDVKRKENDVVNKQAALDQAQEQLEGALLRAPFDGVVATVDAQEGDRVTSGKLVITLVDTGKVTVKAAVDEVDVAQVKAGQDVVTTLDSLPDVVLSGKVLTVAPSPTTQAGVVSYAITVSVDNASGQQTLREGMTALASIVIQRKANALMVPSRAIKTVSGGQVVEVVRGEQTETRPVRTGLTNGQWTEIVEGLGDGESVAMEVSSTTTQRQQSPTGPQFQRGMGGMQFMP